MGDRPEMESAEIAFESADLKGAAPSLRISGVPAELLRSPEKIRALMELLELPEGTNARVTISSSSVIIR